MQVGHLPAYRDAGLEVMAITDLDPERARQVASQFDVPYVADDASAIFARDDVDIVDVAVTPGAQHDLVLAALASGKHVLCQKPFALDLAPARELVAAAVRHDRKLAVNQQMRWSPLIVRLKALLDAGDIGTVDVASISVSIATDWSAWPWLVEAPRLDVFFHSIHYLDVMRFLFGEPSRLTSLSRRSPEQMTRGESITHTVLEFPQTLAYVSVNHNNNAPSQQRAEFQLVGAQGAATGEIGALYDYPHGRPDRLSFQALDSAPAVEELEGRWFPDAFAGPMRELMAAIDEEREPVTSGRDNLLTLRLVVAAYESQRTGAAVALGPDLVAADVEHRAGF